MIKNAVKSLLAVGLSGVIMSGLLLPVFKTKKTQYQLSDYGVYKKIKVEPKEQVLGEDDQDYWAGSQFKQWSVLENHAGGYKLMYPAGFSIDYSQAGKLVLNPPSGGGQVLGYVKDGGLTTVVVVEGLDSQQVKLIKATEAMLNQSFRLTSNPGYNQEVAKQRFN